MLLCLPQTKPVSLTHHTLQTVYSELVGYIACFISNLYGNTLTLVAFCKFSSLREKTYKTLIALTVADLMVSLFPCLHYVKLLAVYKANFPLWKKRVGIQYFTACNALFHVMYLAADRFFAIMWPFIYKSKVTKRTLWCGSFSVSGIAVGLTLYYTLNYQNYEPERELMVCVMDISGFTTFAIVFLILQCKITSVAKKHQNQIAALDIGESAGGKKKKIIDKATSMAVTVVCTFMVFWFPLVLSSFIKLCSPNDIVFFTYFRQISRILLTLNSSVNFVLYACLNSKFRQAYKYILSGNHRTSNVSSFDVTQVT